jgi:hypothetical protein
MSATSRSSLHDECIDEKRRRGDGRRPVRPFGVRVVDDCAVGSS